MSDPVHHPVNSVAFNSLLSTATYVVVYFFADWCGPCKAIAPHYASLAQQYSVPGHFAFAKVNVDHPALRPVAAQYRVSAMPTFLFFKQGKQVGVSGKAAIQGADVKGLVAAVEKVGRLAREKAEGK